MNTRARFALPLVVIFAYSFASAGAARGQRMSLAAPRSSPAPVRAMPVAPRAVLAHPLPPRGTTRGGRVTGFNTATKTFTFADGSFLPLQSFLNPCGGFGFGFTSFSAGSCDLGIKAVIDPVTQWQLAVAERVLNATRGVVPVSGFTWLDGGGWYVPPAEPAPVEQPQPQPQIIVVQPPAAPQAAAPTAPAAPPETAPAPPEVGQFVLALRNGTQIQAVAFTRVQDRIIYITADGSRRMIAASDLDPGATTLINEELGTPLQLPL